MKKVFGLLLLACLFAILQVDASPPARDVGNEQAIVENFCSPVNVVTFQVTTKYSGMVTQVECEIEDSQVVAYRRLDNYALVMTNERASQISVYEPDWPVSVVNLSTYTKATATRTTPYRVNLLVYQPDWPVCTINLA